MTTTTTAQALTTKKPGDIVSDMIGSVSFATNYSVIFDIKLLHLQLEVSAQAQPPHIGGDATGIMMAAAKLATTATGPATTNKVDDVIDDINKKKQSIRSEAEVNTNLSQMLSGKLKWPVKNFRNNTSFSYESLCLHLSAFLYACVGDAYEKQLILSF